MIGKTKSLLTSLALLALASATLSVYNLQALGENDQALLNISYSIANYGFAPLGKTIVGKLVASPKFGPECTPETDPNVDYENKFILIPRGECEFVTKTLNAQKLGAQMAIIMDEKDHKGNVIMTDNGYGYKVSIPSLFIHYQDGEKLKALLEDNEGEDDADVIMKITFQNQKTQQVNVTLYLQANNRESYRFVENFRKFYPKVEQHINLQLVYANSRCPTDCLPADCYFNNNYCALNFIRADSANGQLILDQQIREQLLFKLHPDKWWDYMKQVGNECASISQLEQCSEKALKKVGEDPVKFKTKFTETFAANKDNQYLFSNKEHLALAGVNRFPTVTLNRMKLKGTLHAEFVFDDICNTLQDPPNSCQKYIESKDIIEKNISNEWTTLVLVLVLGVLAFSLIFCLYRRHMKKKISKEMQGRVDDMVSKYIEFYSERSKA